MTAQATHARTPARDRILEAVFQLVASEGIGSVTNRRVAAAASVSLGSLTYHFPNQRDLLREGLRRYIHEEIRRIEEIAKELRDRGLDGAQLGTEIERFSAFSADRPELLAEMELHLHAARDPELREVSQQCFDAYEDLAAAAMRVLGIPEPGQHSAHVVNLMMGTGLRQLATGKRDASELGDALETVARGAIARARASEAAGTG